MAVPRITQAWTVDGTGSLDCLKLDKERVLPELSDNEVLVKIHAASLNYRDFMIPMVTMPYVYSPIPPTNPGQGYYPFAMHQMSSQALTAPEKSWQLVLKSLAFRKDPKL
jgi:hypothetical protein